MKRRSVRLSVHWIIAWTGIISLLVLISTPLLDGCHARSDTAPLTLTVKDAAGLPRRVEVVVPGRCRLETDELGIAELPAACRGVIASLREPETHRELKEFMIPTLGEAHVVILSLSP